MLPKSIKTFHTLAVESNVSPSLVTAMTLQPNTQITDLTPVEFKQKEGMWYANFLRDRLSPNATGGADLKAIRGDEMRSFAMRVSMVFDTSRELRLRFVDIGFNVSEGHTTNSR